MAEKEFDPEDPMALTGMVVALPAEEAQRAEKEMTACFIEEYLRMGYAPERLLELFRDPFYQALHAAYRSRGEAYVRDLIREVQGEETSARRKEVRHGQGL